MPTNTTRCLPASRSSGYDVFDSRLPPIAGRASVVIPAFNCEATVGAAIESCCAQSHADVEIIVVDDGSTDRTPEVLRGFGSRIRVITQVNGGLAAARNAGIRAATGEFVAWMDGDDLALPERLMMQVAVLASWPSIKLVSSDFSAFLTDMPDFATSHIGSYYRAVKRLDGIARIYPFVDTVQIPDGCQGGTLHFRWGQAYESLLRGNFVHPPTVMVRRSALDEAGLFDEMLRFNSDYDLIVRIARTGPFAFIDAPLLRYRVSSTQMSHAGAAGRIPLETIAILEKVRVHDPETYWKFRSLFRLRKAELLILAAEGMAASNRPKAFWLLVKGLGSGPRFHGFIRALAYIMVPGFALSAVRRARLARAGSRLPPV